MVTPTTEISTLSLHDALPIYAHNGAGTDDQEQEARERLVDPVLLGRELDPERLDAGEEVIAAGARGNQEDRKSTRLNSSHVAISYAVFCLKKKIEKHAQELNA